VETDLEVETSLPQSPNIKHDPVSIPTAQYLSSQDPFYHFRVDLMSKRFTVKTLYVYLVSLDGFSRSLKLETFIQICREKPNLVQS
jgi:hypothetical protein